MISIIVANLEWFWLNASCDFEYSLEMVQICHLNFQIASWSICIARCCIRAWRPADIGTFPFCILFHIHLVRSNFHSKNRRSFCYFIRGLKILLSSKNYSVSSFQWSWASQVGLSWTSWIYALEPCIRSLAFPQTNRLLSRFHLLNH